MWAIAQFLIFNRFTAHKTEKTRNVLTCAVNESYSALKKWRENTNFPHCFRRASLFSKTEVSKALEYTHQKNKSINCRKKPDRSSDSVQSHKRFIFSWWRKVHRILPGFESQGKKVHSEWCIKNVHHYTGRKCYLNRINQQMDVREKFCSPRHINNMQWVFLSLYFVTYINIFLYLSWFWSPLIFS